MTNNQEPKPFNIREVPLWVILTTYGVGAVGLMVSGLGISSLIH